MKALKFLVIPALALCASACQEDAKTAPSVNIPQEDKTFIVQAGATNQADIEYSQVAAQRSSNDLVLKFSRRIINENSMAQNELITLSDGLNTTTSTTITSEQQQIKDKLSNLSGFAFDTAYMHAQVRDHLRANTAFEAELNGDGPQSLKDYCYKSLGTIKLQLAQADSIWNSLAPNLSAARKGH